MLVKLGYLWRRAVEFGWIVPVLIAVWCAWSFVSWAAGVEAVNDQRRAEETRIEMKHKYLDLERKRLEVEILRRKVTGAKPE